MKNNKNKVAFLILGSPRSGTSLLSNIISEHGVYFGEKKSFVDPNKIPINPEFFELRSVNQLNQKILNHLKFNYLDFNFIPDYRKLNKNVLKKFNEKITNIVINDLDNRDIIGIKDPRLSFTFQIWKDTLTSLDFNVYGIISFRSIVDTIISNKKSNNFNDETNNLIPGIHYLSALELKKNNPDILGINYNHLLNGLYDNLKEIIHKAEITFDKNIVRNCIDKKYVRNSSLIEDNVFHECFRKNIDLSYLSVCINALNSSNNKFLINLNNKLDNLNNDYNELKKNNKAVLKENLQLRRYFEKVESFFLVKLIRYFKEK